MKMGVIDNVLERFLTKFCGFFNRQHDDAYYENTICDAYISTQSRDNDDSRKLSLLATAPSAFTVTTIINWWTTTGRIYLYLVIIAVAYSCLPVAVDYHV